MIQIISKPDYTKYKAENGVMTNPKHFNTMLEFGAMKKFKTFKSGKQDFKLREIKKQELVTYMKAVIDKEDAYLEEIKSCQKMSADKEKKKRIRKLKKEVMELEGIEGEEVVLVEYKGY